MSQLLLIFFIEDVLTHFRPLDIEALKRQKEELLQKKQAKERALAELIPTPESDREQLRLHREVCNSGSNLHFFLIRR